MFRSKVGQALEAESWESYISFWEIAAMQAVGIKGKNSGHSRETTKRKISPRGMIYLQQITKI